MDPIESHEFVEKPGQEHVEEVPKERTVQDSQRENDLRKVEQSLLRKLDWNFVSVLFVLYMLSFLDRSNIGNAETAGMTEDLDMSDADYQWLLTAFYIAYIVFEWMVLLWKVLPPHIYAASALFVWGIVAMMQGVAKNWSTMMALRFLLGTGEAAFGPGVPYFLSFFYMREEVGKRIGIFLSAAPLATTFAGALAYGLTSAHASIPGWRLLFLVEGAPTVLMSAVAFFFLPDAPHTARFLTQEEKEVAYARGVRQVGDQADSRIGLPEWADILPALKDPKNWIIAIMNFANNVAFSSIAVFLPSIVKAMGYTSINAQGLTCPPFFFAFLICIASSQIAERTRQRGLTIITLSTIGGVGYLMLAISHSTRVRYAAVFLAAAGIFSVVANMFPWSLNNQRSDTKRGVGIAMFHLIGQCGPLLGTRLYPTAEAPYYTKGMAVCSAFSFFSAALAILLRFLLARENRKLDELEASAIGSQPVKAGVGEETDNPNFRNIL